MNPQILITVGVTLILALLGAAVSYGVLIQQVRQLRAEFREMKRADLVKRVEAIELIVDRNQPLHGRHKATAQG